ncbi:hypothetical protein PTI98_012952 [Pleurotus ostreatus]|nr:hypothetical protein PTI98_012952 [Pleurotus ostreatus]
MQCALHTAHRWAVLERIILHRDISHGNIFVRAEDFREEDEKELAGKGLRPIFASEIVENVKDAAPMARLVDMDNAAELDRRKAVSPSFVARRNTLRMNDEPLRFRTGTPKFIARSPAAGRLLVTNLAFRRMPQLAGDLAAKYRTAHSNDPSGLRKLVDARSTKHGGVYDADHVEETYEATPELIATAFAHHPRHDAESVFWCMVVFLLVAVPLGSPDEAIPDDADDFALVCAWRHIADHQAGPSQDIYICDSRAGLLAAGELWNEWLHCIPELAHAGPLLAALASQVSPEWAIPSWTRRGAAAPAPPPRGGAACYPHLQHIDVWKTGNREFEFEFDTGRGRTTHPPDTRRYARGSPNVRNAEYRGAAQRRRRTQDEAAIGAPGAGGGVPSEEATIGKGRKATGSGRASGRPRDPTPGNGRRERPFDADTAYENLPSTPGLASARSRPFDHASNAWMAWLSFDYLIISAFRCSLHALHLIMVIALSHQH